MLNYSCLILSINEELSLRNLASYLKEATKTLKFVEFGLNFQEIKNGKMDR